MYQAEVRSRTFLQQARTRIQIDFLTRADAGEKGLNK